MRNKTKWLPIMVTLGLALTALAGCGKATKLGASAPPASGGNNAPPTTAPQVGENTSQAEVTFTPLPPVSTAPVTTPVPASSFIVDNAAAVQLGKALFWDMQVGSDGVQACASCHFQAGADVRATNEVNPGQKAGDNKFDIVAGANQTVTAADFPFHQLATPGTANSAVVREVNDVMGSMGVQFATLSDISEGSGEDDGVSVPDAVFNALGGNVRQVTGRNAPSVINAVFNFSNFWDGRANHFFNGVNPFGPLDATSGIVVDTGNGLASEVVRIDDSSLASQSVGPPGNNVEMSFDGRTFPQIGKKMLSLKPLAKQKVHPQDSVLGSLADTANGTGLTTTYAEMIQKAFDPKYWANTDQIIGFPNPGEVGVAPNPGGTLTTKEFSQMEANFSLFFGLAVQAYESTLVSDQAPIDQFNAGNAAALSASQKAGLALFNGAAQKCSVCHSGPEFTAATTANITANGQTDQITTPNGAATSDTGFKNISVRPTTDDIGRDGTAPFVNPITGKNYPLSLSALAALKAAGQLPPEVAAFTPDLPAGAAANSAVPGSFKIPTLRNVELTGPYFHAGEAATLKQVVEFYSRGGNFPTQNASSLDTNIGPIGGLANNTTAENNLVDFLLSLTDNRVKEESAPFDHPELIIPANGSVPAINSPTDPGVIDLPATGAGGRPAEGLPPLQPFLGLDPHQS